MPNDEQTANDKASSQAAEQLKPDRFQHNGTRHQAHEQGRIDKQKNKCTQRGALRQRKQPLANDLSMRHGLI